MIWAIIFWLSFFAIIHSYIIYPVILSLLARNKKDNSKVFVKDENLPFISIIISVYNEESVIAEKLRSVFHTSYPENKLEVLVGSDASTDRTGDILKVHANDQEGLRLFDFKERRGKPAVINELREAAMGEILVFTDARVMFEKDTLFHLVKHFRNKYIGLVGANIRNNRLDKKGISHQEWSFMSREIKLKYYEGLIWGGMIGAYGALYAVRNEDFSHVPDGYSVDDFYITMKVLEKNKRCILEMNAIGHENVPNKLSEEFRRKIRISAGNFQNLRNFYRMLWPPHRGLSFSFFSHKVLRWMGPFLLLIIMGLNIVLAKGSPFYMKLLLLQTFILICPIIDLILRKIGLHIVILRFITHFYSMNLALLAGFLKFIKGTETNVWHPTKRDEN